VPRGSQSFDAVLVFGAEAVAKAARAAKANLLITVSGIGAHAEASSAAARAKALGEQAAARAFPGAISVRPSVIFGPDDRFFNRTAAMARYMPLLPLFGGGTTRMQPVFAGDVAEAMAILIGRGEATGLTYELGGPRIATLRELMHFTLHTLQRRRILLPVPWGIARAIGSMAGFLPSPPITADQVEMLKPDNVVSAAAIAEGRDLRGLGVAARSFEAIVPTYLYRFRKEGQFTVPSGTPQ
jgi:NADH dehydrogenase